MSNDFSTSWTTPNCWRNRKRYNLRSEIEIGKSLGQAPLDTRWFIFAQNTTRYSLGYFGTKTVYFLTNYFLDVGSTRGHWRWKRRRRWRREQPDQWIVIFKSVKNLLYITLAYNNFTYQIQLQCKQIIYYILSYLGIISICIIQFEKTWSRAGLQAHGMISWVFKKHDLELNWAKLRHNKMQMWK